MNRGMQNVHSMELQIWTQGDGEQHEVHMVKTRKAYKIMEGKPQGKNYLGDTDTEMDLREICYEDVNMIDL